jgi:hypothetical protein
MDTLAVACNSGCCEFIRVYSEEAATDRLCNLQLVLKVSCCKGVTLSSAAINKHHEVIVRESAAGFLQQAGSRSVDPHPTPATAAL